MKKITIAALAFIALTGIIAALMLTDPATDISDEELQQFITDPDLKEGGAAMMAYARMQFSEMPDTERKNVIKGLLRYCELDTFAMVLIWEFFRNEVYD